MTMKALIVDPNARGGFRFDEVAEPNPTTAQALVEVSVHAKIGGSIIIARRHQSRHRARENVATHCGEMTSLSAILRHIHDHLVSALRIPDLAKRAGLSPFQFDQRLRSLFGLSAGQHLTRVRIELVRSPSPNR